MKLFIGNLPLNAKEDDVRRHVLEHVGDVEEGFIVSASATTTKRNGKPYYCYGSVTLSSSAEMAIPKLHGTLMKGHKIKVKLYRDSKESSHKLKSEVKSVPDSGTYTDGIVKLHHSYSQPHFQEIQGVHVIAMAIPPLMEHVQDDVVMEHFKEFDEQLLKVECFECQSRPYFKIRLTFQCQDTAKTCTIRMNGSLLLGKHKLKLKSEPTVTRKHSLPAAAMCGLHQNDSGHHHQKKSSLNQPLQMNTVLSCVNESPSVDQSSLTQQYYSMEQSCSVKVTNIKPQISKKVLAAHFFKVGKVVDCKIYTEKKKVQHYYFQA